MSDALPQSNFTAIDGQLGSAFALGGDVMCVIGCCSSGVYTPRMVASVPDLVATFGHGPAVELAAYIIEKSRKRVLFVRTPSTTAGTNSAVDEDGVTGTSTVTLSGTPLDSYEGRFEVVAGGTRGTAGITFKYSLDGGATYSPTIALGTAVTYDIPHTGLTLAFGAGTLVAGDYAVWTSTEPRWSSADITAAFTALGQQQQLFIASAIAGIIDSGDFDDIASELDSYAATKRRPTFAFTSARRQYLDCRKVGSSTVTFAENSPAADTITRASGSWVTDGFKAGMTITVSGSASNDGTYTLETVTALTLTLVSGDDLVAEATVSNVTVTGTESRSAWMAAVRADFDGHDSTRVSVSAGHGRTKSPITIGGHRRKVRRPASWGAAARFMTYDLAVSLAEQPRGPIPDVTLYDSNGDPEDHDEAVDELALAGRFLCYRTFDGFSGVYVALPMILHPDGSDFARVHHRAVMDLACQTAQRALVQRLSTGLELNDDGTILEGDALRVERFVLGRLEAELMQKRRCSAVVYSVSRTGDLTKPGAKLSSKVSVLPLFYVEQSDVEVGFIDSLVDVPLT